MALVSASPQRPEPVPAMERSNSKSASSIFFSSADISSDRDSESNSSSTSQRDAEVQAQAAIRSEEYRQLFRLSPEEVLVEDFNCALQENILIQGHMYLFVHHICFYSNIFGFETKKIIPFQEVTSVRRAKTAGIFPNAIEIAAGDKKYFFASFLSRDEAFKLINDGWLQHGNAAEAIAEKQELVIESSSQENGLLNGNSEGSGHCVSEVDASERNESAPNLEHSAAPSSLKDDLASASLVEIQSKTKEDTLSVLHTESSASGKTWTWTEENSIAPKIPESYTKVTESKFPINVEEFFRLFISDEAVNFTESFHKKSGDIEFKCSPWHPDKDGGHSRRLSFQHPVKIYIGAKFGSCKEVQKFRVYRDSHLVIERSQEINDVPYGDYFRVEGIWDVRRDNSKPSESCVLRMYINVAFLKKTMFRGKIVQSTLEECRGVSSLWTDTAHEFLKQKNIERQAEESQDSRNIQNSKAHSERGPEIQESSDRSNGHIRAHQLSDQAHVDQQVSSPDQGSLNHGTSVASLFEELLTKLWSTPRNRKLLPLLLAITFVVLLLMQLSILVLLSRPQHIHVSSPVGYGLGKGSVGVSDQYEAQAWLEKRMHYLKEEMLAVESRIERMQREHLLLKAHLKELERLAKQR